MHIGVKWDEVKVDAGLQRAMELHVEPCGEKVASLLDASRLSCLEAEIVVGAWWCMKWIHAIAGLGDLADSSGGFSARSGDIFAAYVKGSVKNAAVGEDSCAVVLEWVRF